MVNSTYTGKWIQQKRKSLWTGQTEKRKFRVIATDNKVWREIVDKKGKKIEVLQKW